MKGIGPMLSVYNCQNNDTVGSFHFKILLIMQNELEKHSAYQSHDLTLNDVQITTDTDSNISY